MPKLQKTKVKSIVAPDITKYDAQLDKVGDYKLTALISDKERKVSGRTLLECLEKLINDEPIKGKCVLSVEKGKLRSTIQLPPMKIKRLFQNKVYRIIIEKQLNLRLT